MMSAPVRTKCKACMWWDSEHVRLDTFPKEYPGIPNPGICRKHKPGGMTVKAFVIGMQPVMDADESCGEGRQGE